MGEVYKARDTRLDRTVAIKILPEAFAADADRVARFQREAKTLAALNHPNIAQIFGLEQAGDVHALAMEFVAGDDLSDRIARGPIPIDEALPIAKQIAEALEAAHEQGIIHRDLKPANIKLRPDGTVKVLDFGLAKATDSPGTMSVSASMSPTLTSPAVMTGMGVILGTAAYMSPEQARGTTADRRVDLWAFGVVLWEMLTAKRPFEGATVSDTLASVLKTEPDWNALAPTTPAAIRRLLRRCLEKERKRRFDSATAARLEIEEAMTGPLASDGAAAAPEPPARLVWSRALPWAVAGVLCLVALLVWASGRSATPPHVMRTTIATSGPEALTMTGINPDLALSPDGTHVVYVGNNGTQLFVRALDTLEPVAIASGSAVRGPFVSPDGQWVGFSNNNSLQKVAMTGGPPITLASGGGIPRGATWARDDMIIFATGDPATGLQRMSAAGGTPEVLTRPDRAQGEADHLWPELLPGGRAVLFTITSQTGGLDTAQVAVQDLRTGTHAVLLRGGSHAQYVASGHLVYVAAGGLRAIAFDLKRLETHGAPVPVLPRLVTTVGGAGDFSLATDGTLVYADAPGSLGTNARTLVWVDRAGNEEPVAAPPHAYLQPRLSPDGTRVALLSTDQVNDLWVWDLGRRRLTPLTLDPGEHQHPVWTQDGRRIIFGSNRGGNTDLWWQAADGTGVAERLTTTSEPQFPSGVTPDGIAVVFFKLTPTMGRDLLQVALDGTGRVTPLLQTTFDEREGVISPDGLWLAYESNQSGSFEIYVRPFPNVDGGLWRVSTAGGSRPLWARSGKELFYLGADGALLRVPIEAKGATWDHRTPTKLFERRYYIGPNSGRSYDVSQDGQRFLMIKLADGSDQAASANLIVVQHWTEELKRLVPTK
jgi:eukaryotic-like serine/threonine-protein kinase